MRASDKNQQEKIYVASSWRNKYQENCVKVLRELGYEVYDFKEPTPGQRGFSWSDIDPNWLQWSPAQFREALKHPIAQKGFNNDREALEDCESCLLVLPSGRSAHFEAGWTAGRGKATAIYMPELPEPELMYKLCEATTPLTFPLDQTEFLISMDEVRQYYSLNLMRRPQFDCRCNPATARNNLCIRCGGSVSG